jgi:hypothetical protein
MAPYLVTKTTCLYGAQFNYNELNRIFIFKGNTEESNSAEDNF